MLNDIVSYVLGLQYLNNITYSRAGVHLEGVEDNFNVLYWLGLLLISVVFYTSNYGIFYQNTHISENPIDNDYKVIDT